MNTPCEAEANRLAVAREYPLTDRSADAALCEACRLATLLCHRPIAAVEFVLQDTVIVAAAAGLHVGRIQRSDALSPHFLQESRVVTVSDASADARFAPLKLVRGARGVRFYAAVPLLTPEGVALGVLSVWDHYAGDLAPSQAESLEALGRMVMVQLNLWRRQRQLERLEAQHALVEAALREAEGKFRGIFENTVVGIYQTTPEGRYLSANPMLAKIYGYRSPEELMDAVGNIGVQLYIDPRARDRFIEALQKEDTITNFEAQIRRKDGTVIWIAENARVVRGDDGTVRFYEGTVQDITARRLAEDQLRNSEMLYHSLVEELPQNILRKDTRERFIFANSRFCETVERPLEEVLGKTDFDLFPPELARKYQADDQKVMADGKTVRVTERNVTPDGAVHWVEVIKSPLRDISGAVVGIQGIFWDVTEPKRLQDALAYERDLLQALLDHSPDIIYFKDPQSRFLKVGKALARRFDIADPETLVGKTSAALLAPDRAQAVEEEEQRLLKTGEPIINKVEELVDQSGRRSWTSVTKVPIYNRSGEILGLVGVFRDITQLIETEQALREAEEKYRTIFENSVEGIYQTSPGGGFIRVNPALARIYGYASPEELMARLTDVRTQVYVDPRRREEFVRMALEKGSITGFESEIYRKDGSTTWVSESARVVRDRDGKPAYFEGTLEDISSRKQVDAAREKARQVALESARMKSEFVATVSHEIRTPLNAIVPNAERLLETRLDLQQRYLVEGIEYGAHMLLQIVNDILDLSRIESGAVSLENIDFDLHELVERTVSFFASRAHAKGLELVGDIQPGVPHRVRGDSARLGQILNNLVGNAIKFTEAGEVGVEVEPGEASDAFVDLKFRVRDTGIGIAPEARERVFQAFAQADGSMSRRYGGTGLGLAISRKVVQLMGGDIDFTSELGKGTTFFLNVRFAPSSHDESDFVPERLLEGLRVLVLDDNAAQRRVIMDSFLALGATTVAGVASIDEAVESLRAALVTQAGFHLVFYDADLPGSDGIQTARRLRAAGAGASRLIALTAPGTVADARGLEAAGIAGTLVKPLRQSRLVSDLGAILQVAPATEVPEETTSEAPPGQGLRVLLVEDHPLNQRVATELLERLGASVDGAFNGPAALSAFERKRYDLVLMDCQMPDMDGYETTRRLRDLEKALGGAAAAGKRVPIVALSANALTGDRDLGLAAGMDDYLTKPLRQPELIRILRQVKDGTICSAASGSDQDAGTATAVPAVVPGPDSTTPSATSDAPPILDEEPLLALSSPDEPDALPGFVQQFLEDAPRRIRRLREFVSTGEAQRAGAEAHGLKGSASYMGARRLVQACARLEKEAQQGNLESASQGLAEIEAEFAAAKAALEQYVARPS
ncbi:MAG: PAS domain S-box protein [Verrucomicrobiales bacterium]|nr:PAS domain S-box protein [Verrucomicrobiales bacterium]